MAVQVDARGLACPQPVLATKKALEAMGQGVIVTVVDNAAAKENVVKFATASKCQVRVETKDKDYHIVINKGAAAEELAPEITVENTSGMVYVITQDTIGHGNKELGGVLMKSFCYTLLAAKPLPRTLLFLNSGVMLTVKGSPVLEYLQGLAAEGVEILSCGTCLDYYQLKDTLAVGGITNMYTIIEAMNQGGRVITL